MALSLAFIVLIVYCCGRETVSALLVGQQQQHHHLFAHGYGRARGHLYPGRLICRDPHYFCKHPPPLRNIIMPAALISSAISDSARMMKMKELALQLKEENIMPPMNSDGDYELPHLNDIVGSSHRTTQNQYDEDDRSPIESEFMGFISQFLSYTEQDIQSLTTTSNLYLNYSDQQQQHQQLLGKQASQNPPPPRRRSREEGIRYRTIFSGVQAAALEHEVLRAFTILFEDYIPIRLAGRRIYRHLHNVMEEVRAERRGEMERALELCPGWDIAVANEENEGSKTTVLEYGRRVWDTLMDEALLLEHALESSSDDKVKTAQDGGVISVHQLLELGIDRVLIQEGMVDGVSQLEIIIRSTVRREEADIAHHHGRHHDPKKVVGHKDEVMTFPMFMNMLFQCTSSSTSSSKQSQDGRYILDVIQKIEQQLLNHRIAVSGADGDHDVSSLLAAKAVHCGNSILCAKREKYSNRFDEYVSTFQLWERKFVSGGDDTVDSEKQLQHHQQQQSRRFEILRGCFVGARNRRNVAALKIVYMDYAALRVAGDIIFQLMSKFTNKIM